jgi:hypothetical protein
MVFNAQGRSVRPKHVACVDGLINLVVVEGGRFINFLYNMAQRDEL